MLQNLKDKEGKIFAMLKLGVREKITRVGNVQGNAHFRGVLLFYWAEAYPFIGVRFHIQPWAVPRVSLSFP